MEECEECGDCWRWEVESYLDRAKQTPSGPFWASRSLIGQLCPNKVLWLVQTDIVLLCDRSVWFVLHEQFCIVWVLSGHYDSGIGLAFKRTFHGSIFNNLSKNARRGKQNQKLAVIMPQDPDEAISSGMSDWVSYVSSLLRERLPSSLRLSCQEIRETSRVTQDSACKCEKKRLTLWIFYGDDHGFL